MWRLTPNEDALAERWRSASPFPHLVIDDVLEAAELAALMAELDEESVEPYEAELFRFEASAPEPRSDELRAIRAGFAEMLAPPLTRITGRRVTRVDMRAFAYRPGHYLLPHTDHQEDLARQLAYIFYLPTPEPPIDGALELFACRAEGGEIVATESARLIEPRPNRLVVFEVADVSLHQVREVLGGLRISLAGWFYP